MKAKEKEEDKIIKVKNNNKTPKNYSKSLIKKKW
jgi:hypothetical protein